MPACRRPAAATNRYNPMLRPPETFTTERLVARLPRVEDAEAAFAAYASDPEVTRYLSWRYYTEVEPLRKFLRQAVREGFKLEQTWAAMAQTLAPIPAAPKR